MKSLFKSALVILSVMFFTACGNETKSEEETTKLDIHLNNGEKWIANAETSEGINRLNEQLEDFSRLSEPTVQDYNELATLLSETMSELVDQCSMDGEAHDQLHVFIVPIFKYIKIIKGDNLENCKQSVKHLSTHLEMYNNYFTLEA